MAEREVDLLGDAIANTDAEIHREAFEDANEDGEGNDRSLEVMEGDEEDEAEGDEPEAEAEPEPKEPVRDEQGKFKAAESKPARTTPEPQQQEGRVPSSRLKAEADARRAAEDRATQASSEAAAAKAELAAINAKMDGILAGLSRPAPQAQQTQPQQAPQPPDMFADPVGYTNWLRSEIKRESDTDALNESLAEAHAAHGKEFEEAYTNLTRNPNDPAIRATAQRIMASPRSAGRALMKWHGEQRTLAEVGADPNAYRTRIETEAKTKLLQDPEIRRQIFEEMRQEAAGNGGRPARSVTRLPKSLNGAAGGQSAQGVDPRTFDNSDRGVFEDAWES